MTEPSLSRALEIVAGLPFRRIVVQPHLLFCGELVATVQTAVNESRGGYPAKQWLVTEHLGGQWFLTDALASLAGLDEVASAVAGPRLNSPTEAAWPAQTIRCSDQAGLALSDGNV